MTKKSIKTLATATLLLATAGCAVGPNYKRPLVEVPTNFRAEPASSSAPDAATTLGDEQWVEIFEDVTLQRLVQEALQNNLDLRMAAQRAAEVVHNRLLWFERRSLTKSLSASRLGEPDYSRVADHTGILAV